MAESQEDTLARSTIKAAISIIIPTFNESSQIGTTLRNLCGLRGDFEILVSDGQSTDGTAEIVEAMQLNGGRHIRLVRAVRNRALQCNQAAREARGRVLLFLHADAALEAGGIEALASAIAADRELAGGNFRVKFEGEDSWSRFFTWMDRERRRFGIYYGDSGLFVRREVFERLGGFSPIPIMDDYEFIRRLERSGRTVCLPAVIRVSDRRWRVRGVWHTMWTWFWIQFCFSLGLPPRVLAGWYKPVRGQDLAAQSAASQTLGSRFTYVFHNRAGGE